MGAHPWTTYGEGPSVGVNTLNSATFNEGNVGYTEKDIRYNQKGNVLYVTALEVPTTGLFLQGYV